MNTHLPWMDEGAGAATTVVAGRASDAANGTPSFIRVTSALHLG